MAGQMQWHKIASALFLYCPGHWMDSSGLSVSDGKGTEVNGRFCIVCEIYCLESIVNLSYNEEVSSREMYNIDKNCCEKRMGG